MEIAPVSPPPLGVSPNIRVGALDGAVAAASTSRKCGCASCG